MKDSQDISLLIVDYLTGEISPDDACTLDQWVQTSEENAHQLIRMREAWIGPSVIEHAYDGESAFLHFKRRVLNRSNISKPTWMDRHQANIRNAVLWAAAILFPILLTCTTIMYFNIKNLCDGETIASTVAGETSTLQLPDGTQVMLKENSQLSYSTSEFIRGHRTIKFQGSAYFSVSSDASHPFLITTEKEQVRVLGTEFFFVSEKGSQKDILSLDKGNVEFTDNKSGKTVRMETGDELVYNIHTGKTYCKTRSGDEVKLAQETYYNNSVSNTVYAELEQNVRGRKGNHTIQLNVSKNLKAGLYQVEISPSHEMACFTPAREAAKFLGGDGSKEHPYLISNTRQMCNMKSALTPYKMTYFALTNDIDLQGVEWIPLNDTADEYSLWVTLNGNGHVIRNLTTNRTCYYGSFFGVLCGECRNVGFENVNIFCTGYGTGAVAGYLGHAAYPGTSTIQNCYATGRVCGQCYAGGLVGNVGGKAVLNRCYSAVDVSSVSSYAGGLVGRIRAPFVMEGCYSSGNVAGQYAGGVVAGGQQKSTPHSRIHDVMAINRSVYGSRQSYAVMPIIEGDTLSHIAHSSNLYLNGKRLDHGLSDKEINQRLNAWRNVWYSSKLTQQTE
ncbi:MAG: FecR domain-containing protein [Bacteroidaceae bacterium]|nr:FecR domain-containing protein [Bacteroidaceae bacterium]